MEASSSPQPIDLNQARLKRFNLNEKLSKVVPFTTSPEPSLPAESFDWQFYTKYYEDLNTLSSFDAAHEHWTICGKVEGRVANETALKDTFALKLSELPEDFDFEQYLLLNPDLKTKLDQHPYRSNRAIEHYLEHGKPEGRIYRLPKTYSRTELVIGTPSITFDALESQLLEPIKTNSNTTQEKTRLIAFYLPQFHPIPENDRWWGKGFTEWTNVSKAKSLFAEHYQPHFPADLGFYDLRISEVREMQAALAQKYGIHGFCYYYYWFAGKRLLYRPLDEMLASKKPNFPFCLCWANENWTRRWDGASQEVLIAQDHSPDNDQALAESLVPFLRDERYIRVNNKPLLLVYRIDALPDPLRAVEQWRKIFRKQGIGEVHLCAAFTFGLNTDPTQFGFDAGVQFPPHGASAKVFPPEQFGIPSFTGNIYDFGDVVTNSLAAPVPEDYSLYLGVMPSWDNTARKKTAGNIFLHSNPDIYELWLRGSIEKTKERYQGDERLVFINAWNEWAEGAHLEPDQKYGHGYLSATQKALYETPSIEVVLGLLRYVPIQSQSLLDRLIDNLEEMIACRERSLDAMIQLSQKRRTQVLNVLQVQRIIDQTSSLAFNLERPEVGAEIVSDGAFTLAGWVLDRKSQPVKIELVNSDQIIAESPGSGYRKDVQRAYPEYETANCGFWLNVKACDIHHSKTYLRAVFEDGNDELLCSIDFQFNEKSIPISVELQKQIQWDELHRDGIKTHLLSIRTFPCKENYFRLLDELEYVIRNREEVLKELANFLRTGSVDNFF